MYSVDTQGDGLVKVCFHPYHNLLVCADTLGYIRVLAYDTPTPTKPIHAFHVSNGEHVVFAILLECSGLHVCWLPSVHTHFQATDAASCTCKHVSTCLCIN